MENLSPPNLLHLPDELLIQILSSGNFQLANFATLSRVCKRLNALAVGYLYNQFTVSHGLSYKELDGFRKFGAHTRVLEMHYTPLMLTADKARVNTTSGLPKFLTHFPNITKVVFINTLGISYNHFLYIIRKTLTSNLCLKHVEFHATVLAKNSALRGDIVELLDKPMVNGTFARLEKLVIVYTGNKRGEMDAAERMEGFRKAVGRSLETVKELGVFVNSYLRRLPEVEERKGWECKGKWEMEGVRKVEVVVDCWPWWDMGVVDLGGGGVEELVVGVGVWEVKRRLRMIGADGALQVSDLRDIARTLVYLERIVWFCKLGWGDELYPKFLTERKVFLVERVNGVGGRVEVREEGEWEGSRERITNGFAGF
ncbi:uncharacterized protein DFL_005473 [Arthrobotrys flagrans]|uniref:F-box domain-containing protein n=1 Tax=Arthrobotrys flagrans TaxID=97331 RepID=A0A436ZXI4_ARTFL|nr:hypothetical protein DFL_005473 [Arthrobotrys flagrans]